MIIYKKSFVGKIHSFTADIDDTQLVLVVINSNIANELCVDHTYIVGEVVLYEFEEDFDIQ